MKQLLLPLIFIIFLISLASATVYETNLFNYGVINNNGTNSDTNIPLSNVNVMGFVCGNSDCSIFAGVLWDGNILTGDQITLTYPTELQSNYGYAVYIYKDGYRTYERKGITWHGDGNAPSYTNYLRKQESATSVINNMDISVNNNNLKTVVNIQSPLEHMGPLNIVPPQLINYYSSTVDVTLNITNKNTGETVYTETKSISVEYSASKTVSFSKNILPGNYDIKVYTSLNNEPKCLSYIIDELTKSITIPYPDNDKDGYPENIDCNDNNKNIWQLLKGYSDNDKDGFGFGIEKNICSGNNLPEGYVNNDDDCDDNAVSCNLDCESKVYLDLDNDGYGWIFSPRRACDSAGLPFPVVINYWDCNDNDSSINPGTNEVCDDEKDNNCNGQIDEGCSIDLTPSINLISANPTNGFAPLNVELKCHAVGGNGALFYSWNFGDSGSANGQNQIHTYQTAGVFEATCTVTDQDGDKDSELVKINVSQNELNITGISCFEKVVENHNQSCSVSVRDSRNIPEPDVNVNVYYSDGTEFGRCSTNSITGSCAVADLQTDIGGFEVYAVASKQGVISDNDKKPTFSYNVVKEVYEVTNLKVFSNGSFSEEDYDFFRGENLFVSFSVRKDGVPVENIITKASLVSPQAGGRIDLTKISDESGEYFYELRPIPTTHYFIGENQIFVFAFNFVNASGGQQEVILTIRNNNPVISIIPNQKIEVGETVSINLSAYESDIEDSGDNLRWEFYGDSHVNLTITDKKLSIKGIEKGESEIKLRLYDLDNNFDEQTFKVFIESETQDGKNGKGGRSSRITNFCEPIWKCSDWGECIDGIKTRTCTDLNYCENVITKPLEIIGCENGLISSISLGAETMTGKKWYSYAESKITLIISLLFILLILFIIIIIWNLRK